MAQCPFMLLSVLNLRHVATLTDEDKEQQQWGSNNLTDPWTPHHWIQKAGAKPETIVGSIWVKTGPSFPSVSICATLSVFTEAGARLNRHSPRCVYQGLCVHGNMLVHNANAQCPCVSSSGQIRKHDFIVLLLCTLTHVHYCWWTLISTQCVHTKC